MNLDEITDIEKLRAICKRCMVQIKETIITPTHIYKEGEWYYYMQDEEEVFIYLESCCGVTLTYDEVEKYLKW